MSTSNLIWFNINYMDMKRHMLMCFFIFMLVSRENEWGRYKDGIKIMKEGKWLLEKYVAKKVIRKKERGS
jgi:hypothetical protein